VALLAGVADPGTVTLPRTTYHSRSKWWTWCQPTATWAAKHGNRYEEIEALFERSKKRILEDDRRAREQQEAREREYQWREQARKWSHRFVVVFVIATIALAGLASYIYSQKETLSDQKDQLASFNEFLIESAATRWHYTKEAVTGLFEESGRDANTGLILAALESLPHGNPEQESDEEAAGMRPLVPKIREDFFSALERFGQFAERLRLPEHDGAVDGVAFSPDGSLVATGSDMNEVRLFDSRTGELELVLSGHEGSIDRIAFSPDGGRLISGSVDDTARIWDLETGKELHRLEASEIWGVAWSPAEERVAVASASSVILWDAESGEKLWNADLPGSPAQRHRDRLWLTEPGKVHIAEDGALIETVELPQADMIRFDGQRNGRLYLASRDGRVMRLAPAR